MESLLASQAQEVGSQINQYTNIDEANINIVVLQNSFNGSAPHVPQGDVVEFDFRDMYKSLSVTAQEIIDKLNEILKPEVPDGIQSLDPAQVTPEATADRIVAGATSFFSLFAEQNPDLEGEELLDRFMETIRGGIEQGYSEAYGTLEGLGAFEFEGVREGVEETKQLIEEKLVAYESQMRQQLGLEEKDIESRLATSVENELLTQAGGTSLNIAA